MKKIFAIIAFTFTFVFTANAQGLWGKLKNMAKESVTNVVSNSTKTKVTVDTLYIQQGMNTYEAANITILFIPESGYIKTQTNCEEEPYHQYMNAKMQKNGDDIKLYRKNDVFIHLFRKNGVYYGIINNQGIIE